MTETFLRLTRWQWVTVILGTLITVVSRGPEFSTARLFTGLFGSYLLIFVVAHVCRGIKKYRADKESEAAT